MTTDQRSSLVDRLHALERQADDHAFTHVGEILALCAIGRILLAFDDPDAVSVHGVLANILTRLQTLETQGVSIMAVLDTLTDQVAATTTAEQSAIVLLNGLAAALAAAGTDPVKLQALQDSLKTNTDALADAVVKNTPAA